MTAQSKADELEKRLRSLAAQDPRRGGLEAELKLWRTKALRSDGRYLKRTKRRAP